MADKKSKEETLDELLLRGLDEYVYIKSVSKYYSPKHKKFYRIHDVCQNILAKISDITLLREVNIIKTYDDICYLQGGKEGYYNLFDETKVLLPSDTPTLNPYIDKLVHNVCGYKEENIEYLYKAIYYKYTHMNDFNLPALVFYGAGGSGKGSIITLLGTIFGTENVLPNLGQADLDSAFSTYKGNKLVVEFAEVSVNNTAQDVKNLNKLKNLILAPEITVNEKGIQQYQMPNIAWFFISSNSNNPIRLDDKQKGNRRFSVIYSRSSLSQNEGYDIHSTITDIKEVRNFLSWLEYKYPEVRDLKTFYCLDNQDKRDLEDQSTSDYAIFWDWFLEKYPDKRGKVSVLEIEKEMEVFIEEFEIFDIYEFKKYFWKNSRYPKKRFRIDGQKYMPYGVYID